jgi:plastocyanin
MSKSKFAGSFLSSIGQRLAGVVLLVPPAVFGTGTTVSIVDFAFNPAAVTIQVNDAVTWSWVGTALHSSTSNDTNLWDSGILSHGATFSHTFNSAGSFPYHCVVHPFMTAAVTVQGQVQTNSITLSSVQRLSAGSFQFTYSTTAGLNYVVERSSNLTAWNALATNLAAGNSATFTDSAAGNGANFYRVELLP